MIIFTVIGLVLFIMTVLTYYSNEMLRRLIYPLSVLAVVRMFLYIYNDNVLQIIAKYGRKDLTVNDEDKAMCVRSRAQRRERGVVRGGDKQSMRFLVHLLYYVIILVFQK